jgi:hypothetical protein
MSDKDRVTTTNPPQASEVQKESGTDQNQNSGGDQPSNTSQQSQPPAHDSPTEGTGTGARAGEYS